MKMKKYLGITFVLLFIFILNNNIILSKGNLKAEFQKSGGFADLNGGTTGGAGGEEVDAPASR